MKANGLTRREFFFKAGGLAALATVIEPTVGSTVLAWSKSVPVPMSPIVLDLSKEEYAPVAQIGKTIKIPNPHNKKRPIIVSRISDTEIAAFSSKCTHWGCEVQAGASNTITCPCHHSVFDMKGTVIHGPAKKNLEQFSASINGSIVTIADKMD